jgi:hypothetical protein
MNLIDKALARLDRDGWHQGGFTDANGNRCCVLGALVMERVQDTLTDPNAELCPDDVFYFECDGNSGDIVADFAWVTKDPEYLQAESAVLTMIDAPQGGIGGIAGWNDADGRTFEEVREALKWASERLHHPDVR